MPQSQIEQAANVAEGLYPEMHSTASIMEVNRVSDPGRYRELTGQGAAGVYRAPTPENPFGSIEISPTARTGQTLTHETIHLQQNRFRQELENQLNLSRNELAVKIDDIIKMRSNNLKYWLKRAIN